MSQTPDIKPLARSQVYQFLALGFGYPDATVLARMKELLEPLKVSLEVIGEGPSANAANDVRAALETIEIGDLEAAYVGCFGHTISKECPPYETEYRQSHIFQKSQTLADVVGFYKAFGLESAADIKDRLDHVSVELEFMQFLCLKEAYARAEGHADEQLAICRDAQERFLDDHLGRWGLAFVGRLEIKAKHSPYEPVAGLLARFLSDEMGRFGLQPDAAAVPLSEEPPEAESADCLACTVADTAAQQQDGWQ